MNKEIILSAKNISKSFSEHGSLDILKDVSLDVLKGESIAIEGKSGSGKSTLLNILGTLEMPSGGQLSICGKSVTQSAICKIRNSHIGFIFQSYHLLDDFSLLDNVLMPAKIARMSTGLSSSSHQRALALLDDLGLKDKLQTPTKFLSGGEKQRACIARALINSPDIIFADEPTGNLDSANAQMVYSMLLNLAKKEGKALIIVTHDKDLSALCNKSFLLNDGFLHPIG